MKQVDGGIFVTILIGIAGGLASGFIRNKLRLCGHGCLVNILNAVVGATLLLWISKVIKARNALAKKALFFGAKVGEAFVGG